MIRIERHVGRLLLTAALGALGTFLPVAAQAQDLARATPDIPLAADNVASTDAANAWQPAGAAPTPEHTGIKALTLTLFDGVKHLPSIENILWAAGGGAGPRVSSDGRTDPRRRRDHVRAPH